MDQGRGLPSGTMVGGEWRIERMLGAGGFGVTYEAHNRKTGAHVALKEYMPSGLCTRPAGSTAVTPAQGPAGDIFKRGLAGFMKEAETLARLDHPSIVRVMEHFEANGTAYMALAYLQGGSVADWLKRLGRRPTQAELDQLLWPLTEALMQVHALFVLHRDIKPDNIMLKADGTPVLIDFGAIKSLVSSETRSIGAGTLNLVTDGYAPPEQYVPDGESLLGPWSDVYALGATVYQAITGSRPPSSPRRQIDDTHRPLAALSPDQIGSGWRPGFLAGIDRALSLKRSDRPQSAMELRSALGLTAPPGGTKALSEIATELAASTPLLATFSEMPSARTPFGGPAVAGSRALARGLVLAGTVALLGAGGWYVLAGHRAEETRRLAEVRREIASATTPEVLDGIAVREPQLAPEIARRRDELASITRSQRLRLLREQIARESTTARLEEIGAAAPELKGEVDRRKSELAAEARAARLRMTRERISAESSTAELDRIASEEPELRVDVEARKLALVRAARDARLETLRARIPVSNDEGELDRIALEAPELSGAARGRKVELARLRADQEAKARADADARRRDRVAALVPGSGQDARDCWQQDGREVCGPIMVAVPKGRFRMGSPDGETGRDKDDGPVREVEVRQPFAVGKFEVTFAEWQTCVDNGGCVSNRTPADQGWGRERRPVVGVSWNDAKEYVAWLARASDKPYRLMTEAEWEYAARAGSQTRWSFGDDEGRLGQHAWFSSNSSSRTQIVGQKAANAWGLHDMHGNVWEWVEDCWIDSYRNAPGDERARTTACTDAGRRVVRGGSWDNNPQNLRSADRDRNTTDGRYDILGFRLARTLNP